MIPEGVFGVMVQSMALGEIKNFVAIDDRIATAGQPTAAQLSEVAAAGFQAVVNLGVLDPSYCLPDEAGLAASLGLAYRHIPVRFDAPRVDDLRAFIDVMDGLADQRVFVHCAANFRVSVFVALWGELRLGWTRERADRHVDRLWRPSEGWAAFLRRCREELFAAPAFPEAAARFAAHLQRAGWPVKIVWARAADVGEDDGVVVSVRAEDERNDDAAWDYEVARAAGGGIALTAVCSLGDATCATISAAKGGPLTMNVPGTLVRGRARPSASR
jgi:protein tyrosine phosphatase (PTP) superfamily phosphohydrolase (DUF442 family)